MQADVLDEDGNLRAADIGIIWEDNETFLHGVRVVGSKFPRPTGQEPVMSTPYPSGGNDDRSSSPMTSQPPSPETLVFREAHPHRPSPEARQGYRPAAPIPRFNNKLLNWLTWFRHFCEQTFAVHHQAESYTEEVEDLEDVFTVDDRPSWNNRRSPDPSASPSLQQMFALARRMGYEMRPIAGQPDAQRRPPGNRTSPDQNRGFRPQTRTGRDYSRIKCFSCGEFWSHADSLPKTGLFPSLQTSGLAPNV